MTDNKPTPFQSRAARRQQTVIDILQSGMKAGRPMGVIAGLVVAACPDVAQEDFPPILKKAIDAVAKDVSAEARDRLGKTLRSLKAAFRYENWSIPSMKTYLDVVLDELGDGRLELEALLEPYSKYFLGLNAGETAEDPFEGAFQKYDGFVAEVRGIRDQVAAL